MAVDPAASIVPGTNADFWGQFGVVDPTQTHALQPPTVGGMDTGTFNGSVGPSIGGFPSTTYSGGVFAGGGATGIGSAGGWNDPNVLTPSAKILAQAFQQGLTGQAAVDWATAHGAPGISYDAQRNQFGLPDGAYVAPNPSNPSTYDLISRGGSGGGGGGSMGGVTPGAGYLGQIYGGQYTVPTAAEAEATPGYQFALQQGLKGIQNSAAAKGTLLTGGTQKALEGYASGLASQNYFNLANLGLNAFNTNYNVFRNNQNDLYGRYKGLADLGYNASA